MSVHFINRVTIRTLILSTLLLLFSSAQAAVTLLDKDQWKVSLSGFAEMDSFNDTTRSLTEVAGSAPIDRNGTSNGSNGRTQFSIRNSRLAFGVAVPHIDDWAPRAYLEFDLLGYMPTVSASASSSESSFYTSPAFRVRHAYGELQSNGWQILFGQTWSLFGFQPAFVPCTVSVPPVTGTAYQRTPRLMVSKTFDLGSDHVQAALSFNRPVQRDSGIPGIDLGARYTMGSRRAPYTSPNGDVKSDPASLALSATGRDIRLPTGTTTATHYFTGAFAVDAMIPILATANEKDVSNTLALGGEFTSGQAYGDHFPGWTGNLPQLGATAGDPNLDAGLGGFDASRNFTLVNLQSFNLALQYHLPEGWNSFVNVGYTNLYSNNIDGLTSKASGTLTYRKAEAAYVNVFHDFSQNLRVAVEYSYGQTTYTDNSTAHNNRLQITGWMRF